MGNIRIEKYSKDKKDLWDNFIENSKTPMFMFKRDFMEYHSDRFKDYSLMFFKDDELIALFPASIHDNQVKSHGGLTYGGIFSAKTTKQHNINECITILTEYLKQNNINKLLYKFVPYIYFDVPSEEAYWQLLQNGGKISRIDISTVIDLKNPQRLSKGRKAQISRAKREGVIIEQSEDFETFIALENKILQEFHNTKAVHTPEELKYLKSKFPQNIELWVSKYEGKIIAGTLIFIYKDVIHTQYMASDKISREIGGLDYLIKYLADKYKSSKKWFDFGISTEQNGNVFNDGLCSQKESFGGRTIVYQTLEMEL